MSGRSPTSRTRSELLASVGVLPFTGEMARSVGITRGRLRAVVERGYVTRLRSNLFVVAPLDSTAHTSAVVRAREALLPLRGVPAVVAGRLAGDLHEVPVISPPGRSVDHQMCEVLVRKSDSARLGKRAVAAMVRPIEKFPDDITEIDGIPVTSLLHSAIDVARMGVRIPGRHRASALAFPEALVPLDSVTGRLGARTPDDAAALIQALRGRFRYAPGIRSVDLALPYLNPLAESPFESWSRGYMIAYGIPRPVLQHLVVGADGREYRVDFCWPELRIIGEADGLAKYGDTPEEFRRAKVQELTRQRALEAAGWTVIRWTWDEFAADPARVMYTLRAAIDRATSR